MSNVVSLQSGLREYNGNLTQYTGMLGGLTPDIHTLKSLNPLTTNHVMVVMYRGPFFMMHYFAGKNGNAYQNREFATYKKVIEYYNMGVQCNIQDATLASSPLQGGFAGRQINMPTVQNAQTGQTLQITVPELVGRPIANFHNMWIDGIADPITGLTTYHGLVSGSVDENGIPQRLFKANNESSSLALDPSPAWEVAEFLIIALDRSGSRVEAAVMALGCVPQQKVGNEIFNMNATGQSQIAQLQLTYSCQYVQSAYVNDLAARYVKQFAVFGNSLNFNPGAGDAFFKNANNSDGTINSDMFNGGNRPTLDAVQSGMGNAPVFKADPKPIQRDMPPTQTITPTDHSLIWRGTDKIPADITNPYTTSQGGIGTNLVKMK